MLLNYLATHSNTVLRYKASDMCLHIDTDAAYLVAPGAMSRIAVYFYLGANTLISSPQTSTTKAPIRMLCKLLKHVVTSTGEAETGGFFVKYQHEIPIWYMLTALNHPQPPKIMKTDTIPHLLCQQYNKSKKNQIMGYALLLDYRPSQQQQILVAWDKGLHNLADYFTEYFPPNYHQHI